MGKATKVRKDKGRAAGNVHPLVKQAALPPEQMARGQFEVAQVANPLGEVVIRDTVVRHKAVRRVPHFETLYRSKVFDGQTDYPARTVFVALEWYAERLALAQSGMFKCGLNVSGGGGSAATHIPTSQAAMEARSDVMWVRSLIAADLHMAFDAVMVDGEAFAETARRLHANRHLCVSVERGRKVLKTQFMRAAIALTDAVADKIMVTNTMRILS